MESTLQWKFCSEEQPTPGTPVMLVLAKASMGEYGRPVVHRMLTQGQYYTGGFSFGESTEWTPVLWARLPDLSVLF